MNIQSKIEVIRTDVNNINDKSTINKNANSGHLNINCDNLRACAELISLQTQDLDVKVQCRQCSNCAVGSAVPPLSFLLPPLVFFGPNGGSAAG